MRSLKIPLPYHGRLLLQGDTLKRYVVSNCLKGLPRDPHTNSVNIDIEVGLASDREDLKDLVDEIVCCYPNSSATRWVVEKVDPGSDENSVPPRGPRRTQFTSAMEEGPVIHEVVVGNIGTVYHGRDEQRAKDDFAEYKAQSETGYGRAAGEQVTRIADGEPVDEYFPPVPDEDDEDNESQSEG